MDTKPQPLTTAGTTLAVLWVLCAQMGVMPHPHGVAVNFIIPTPVGPLKIGQVLHTHPH